MEKIKIQKNPELSDKYLKILDFYLASIDELMNSQNLEEKQISELKLIIEQGIELKEMVKIDLETRLEI